MNAGASPLATQWRGGQGVRFAYRAVDATGKRVRGSAEATDPRQLAQALETQGLLLVAADPVEPSAFGVATPGLGARHQVLEITRALAALLPAGLPLARALRAATNLASGAVATAIDGVRTRVERGESLADALSQHPGLFSPLYVGVVRAGEQSGDLDTSFARVAAQLERDERLRAKLLSASIYPLILLVLGGLAVLVLLLFVIPRFAQLLSDSGARLPTSTATLLAVSRAVGHAWPFLLALLLAAVAAGAAMARSPQGRRFRATALLALPVLGALRREQLAARTARLVAVLLTGGAPLLSAVRDAAQSVGDPVAEDDLNRLRARVREGASFHAALAEGALYPPLLAQLIAVGEESGRLAEFLDKAAGIFEERTERAVERAVALIEPAMIVAFGFVVGFVALSLFQAIYSVNAGSFR